MGGYDQALLLARAAVGWEGFRFVAISRPGYLGTQLALGREPEEQADLCAAVLDALGIREAALIAISGGGQCALQFALRHPERCWGLVMVSACSEKLSVSIPFRFHLMKLIAHIPPLVAAMRKKALENPDRVTINDPEARALFLALKLSTMDRMAQRLPGTQNDITQSRLPFDYPVEQIAIPTLVVHGTEDEAVPFTQAVSLTNKIPRSELFEIPGGQHVSLFTHRQEIQTRVTQFLCAAFNSHRDPNTA
jgi:pimeloyl-ACP methyl ester carboxylesterase